MNQLNGVKQVIAPRSIRFAIGALAFVTLTISASAQQFAIGLYHLQKSTRVSLTQYDYTYTADVTNPGATALNVTGTVTSNSASTIVTKGTVAFGSITSGATITSVDTFTIRQDRTVPFDPASLVWTFTAFPASAACTEDTGMSVVTAGKNVTAYIPNMEYGPPGFTGINAVSIEGGGSSAVIPTPVPMASCASNPVTNQTVCVSFTTPDVYEITGTTITSTLQTANASNLGVVMNALTNMAVITTTARDVYPSMQMLDLSSNTLAPAFAPVNPLSQQQQLAIDPTRNLILSTSLRTFTLFNTSSTGTLTEYGNTLAMEGFFDPRSYHGNPAVDCSTGIAVATVGDPSVANVIHIADLTQATFTQPSDGAAAGTWTAPQQLLNLAIDVTHADGPNISIAAGTHLGFLSAAFAYYPFFHSFGFAAMQLPSASGSGVPTLVDYATQDWPGSFEPAQMTTYTSPNDGRVYGIVANQGFYPLASVAVVDLQLLLDAPRTPGTHTIDPTYDLVANGVIRYITSPF